MNYTTLKYGGAHGGAHGGAEAFYGCRKLSDILDLHQKPTFLKLQGGRSRRGEWRGAQMAGRMAGRFFAYMEGRWRGAGGACEAIFSSKNVFFLMGTSFENTR